VNNLNKQFKKFLKNTTETFDKIITDIKWVYTYLEKMTNI
jgi:hypothetical protein